MITKSDKLSIPYAVKGNAGVKQVDTSERTVDVIANTYNYFDSDYDVLVKGVASKSIQERGPDSKLPGKIKHLSNHDLTKGIGRIDTLEETSYDGKDVLRMQSYMLETDLGEETLIKYASGAIDQHSIGFRYMDLEFIENGSEEWDKVVSTLINPEAAEKAGFMWVVKEIMLYEISSLDGFGANRLTPYIGSKSENKNVQYNNMVTKLDKLQDAYKTGKDKHNIEMQYRQIKQMIYEMFNQEPSLKDTLNEPFKDDTFDINKAIENYKF